MGGFWALPYKLKAKIVKFSSPSKAETTLEKKKSIAAINTVELHICDLFEVALKNICC